MALIPASWLDLTTLKLDDLAAPDDNTDLDVSTLRHGLAPKAPGDATKFLRGDGTWAVPAGKIVTVKTMAAVTSAMGTAPLPMSTYAPVITAGTQYSPLQMTHSLAAAANGLLFDIYIPAGVQSADLFTVGLWDSAVSAALAATGQYIFGGYIAPIRLSCLHYPGSTGAKTYVVRFGGNLTTNTCFVCRSLNAADMWGNAMAATMTLTEVSP